MGSGHRAQQKMGAFEMNCTRCEKLKCKIGSPDQHKNCYVLPPSPCSLDGTPIRYMGAWCECCLGRVWDKLDLSRKRFLCLMAESKNEWIKRPMDVGNNRGFSTAVKSAGVGVYYSAENKAEGTQPSNATAHGQWGWPFAYNEDHSPKTHHITEKGAEVLEAVIANRL